MSILNMRRKVMGASKKVFPYKTAAEVKAALTDGVDFSQYIGEYITCIKGQDTLRWDIVDYDEITHRVTLFLHDTMSINVTGFCFNEREQAAIYLENGLEAGKYKFYYRNTPYTFNVSDGYALPKSIINPYINANNVITYIYLDNITENITHQLRWVAQEEDETATNLGTIGSGINNLNISQRLKHSYTDNSLGSNNFGESTIFYWLNSSDSTVTCPSVTKFDYPYTYSVPGFMYQLDSDFINALDTVNWECGTNSVYECPQELGGITSGPSTKYTVSGKFALPSVMEISGSYGDGAPDNSTVFDYFKNASASKRIRYYNNGKRGLSYLLRSPWYSSPSILTRVASNGVIGQRRIYDKNLIEGPCPICKISGSQQ